MTEYINRPHASAMVRWSQGRDDVVVLSGDLTRNTEADGFRAAHPNRFFSMGLAEQNMLSVAGGFAREGFTPFVYTFAVFMYRRALDQIQMSIAYPALKVRFMGFLPGVTTPGGVTHQAIEDVAIMRSVPNMTVISTGDATDVESLLPAIEELPGPVYIRMQRGRVPRLFPTSQPLRLGQVRRLAQGTDILILSMCVCTEEALRATVAMQARGVSLTHLHVSTLKPFETAEIVDALAAARYGVVTIENHGIIGGLGSAVAETMATHGIGKPLRRIGLRDTYAHSGTKPYLMRHYELDALSLVREVEALLGSSLGIEMQDLAAVEIEAVHGDHKAEAL